MRVVSSLIAPQVMWTATKSGHHRARTLVATPSNHSDKVARERARTTVVWPAVARKRASAWPWNVSS